MHFALPPRKTSQPPPYARAAARSLQNRRKSQLQAAVVIFVSLLCFWLLLRITVFSSWTREVESEEDASDKDFNIILFTLLDDASLSDDYIQKIKTNRDDYAARHAN